MSNSGRKDAKPVRSALGAGIFVLLSSAGADAATGFCGIEAGLWAASKTACRYASDPDEARRRFGPQVLLTIDKAGYAGAEGYCKLRSAKRSGKTCAVEVSCDSEGRTPRKAEFYLRGPDRLSLGTASFFQLCSTAPAKR